MRRDRSAPSGRSLRAGHRIARTCPSFRQEEAKPRAPRDRRERPRRARVTRRSPAIPCPYVAWRDPSAVAGRAGWRGALPTETGPPDRAVAEHVRVREIDDDDEGRRPPKFTLGQRREIKKIAKSTS